MSMHGKESVQLPVPRSLQFSSPRYSVARHLIPWRRDPLLSLAKVVVFKWAEPRLGNGNLVSREFAEAGVTAERLFSALILRLPWIEAHVSVRYSTMLTREKVYDRFHKMTYTTRVAGKSHWSGWSSECPLNNPHLQPYLPLAAEIAASERAWPLSEVFWRLP